MLVNEVTIAMAIFPGKVEAWRRFEQTLTGSRQQKFEAWCQKYDLLVLETKIYDTKGGAFVFVHIQISDVSTAIRGLVADTSQFQVWFFKQIYTLHGIDLYRLAQTIQTSLEHKEVKRTDELSI